MSAFNETVLKVAAKKLRMMQNGRPQEISRTQALVEKEQESALKGIAIAQDHALRRIERALAEKEADVAAQCDYWGAVKRRHAALFEEAKRRREPAPRLLPHPDDVVIDRREGVRIIGPIDEEDMATYDARLKMRAALYLQDRIERTESVSSARGGPGVTSPLLLALLVNHQLPPSLRQTKAEQLHHILACDRLSKREALKACRLAWKAARVDMPRGKTMINLAALIPILTITRDIVHESAAAAGDPEAQEAAMQRFEYRLMTEVPTTSPHIPIPGHSQIKDAKA